MKGIQAQLTVSQAANETIATFGYPDTLIAEYANWVVLLRPQQVTLGALVLACKEPAVAFSEISAAAFAGLAAATRDIEAALRDGFAPDKLNYLMLMMVDPHVHFHVLPRYGGAREFAGVQFGDAGWPAVPKLGAVTELDLEQRAALIEFMRQLWPTAG